MPATVKLLESHSALTAKPRLLLGVPKQVALIYVGLFLAGLLIYSIVWPHAPVKAADSREYMEAAQDISQLNLTKLHDRTPGYPILLALTRSSVTPQRVLFFVSFFLHVLSIWLVAVLLNALDVPKSGLAIFGLLLMLPPYVAPTAYVMSETLTEFSLSAAFVALIFSFSKRCSALLICAAVLVAFSAFVRPTNIALGIALSLVLILVWVLTRGLTAWRVLPSAATVVLASVLLLGGYSAFNWWRFGYFGVTPKLGFSLSTRTLRVLERIPAKDAAVREALIRARDESLIRRNSSHLGTQYMWGGVIDELQGITGLPRNELSKHMLRLNLALIASAPLEYLLEGCRGMAGYWFPQTSELANMGSRRLQLVWTLIDTGVSILFAVQLIAAAGAGLIAISLLAAGIGPTLWRVAKDVSFTALLAYILAGTIVFYTAVISCFFEVGDMRYRAPTIIFMIFMTAVGWNVWWKALRAMRPGKREGDASLLQGSAATV